MHHSTSYSNHGALLVDEPTKPPTTRPTSTPADQQPINLTYIQPILTMSAYRAYVSHTFEACVPSLTSNSYANGYMTSTGPNENIYQDVPIFLPQNIATGLPPSLLRYVHRNDYQSLHGPSNVTTNQHIGFRQSPPEYVGRPNEPMESARGPAHHGQVGPGHAHCRVPFYEPRNIAAGLPPIAWRYYPNNAYLAPHRIPTDYTHGNLGLRTYPVDIDLRPNRSIPVGPVPRPHHIRLSKHRSEALGLTATEVPPNTPSGGSIGCSGSKKVRWGPVLTECPTVERRLQRGSIRDSTKQTFMTVPFAVSLGFDGEEYIVRFSPIPAHDATLQNFETELEIAIPENRRPHFRSWLDTGYKLRIQRLTKRATVAIDDEDLSVRNAAFGGFMNCVFRDATVRVIWF
jgi:hypothetical protein